MVGAVRTSHRIWTAKMRYKPIQLLVLFVLLTFPMLGQTQLVLDGTPSSRTSSSDEGSTDETLTEAQKNEFRLLITKLGDEYIWASREQRQLDHYKSGAFHYFVDPTGGGYIKVFDQSVLPDFMKDPTKPRILYMEHLSLGLQTTTYWGGAESFEP